MTSARHHQYCDAPKNGISLDITCFEECEIRNNLKESKLNEKKEEALNSYFAEIDIRLSKESDLSDTQTIALYVHELESSLKAELKNRHRNRKYVKYIESDESLIKNKFISEFKEEISKKYGFAV
jgi:hypothetical protein